ncbi:MAG: N-acetyltransferase family protein, partial [Gammaproteobacteria bacterium]
AETSLTVAPIGDEDIEPLAALYRQMVDHEPDLSAMRQAFAAACVDRSHILLGAKDSAGVLVGSCTGILCRTLVGKCSPFMVIEDMVVDGKARRTGVGRALVEELERLAHDNACSYIILLTDANRADARSFYSALGYQSDDYRGFKKTLATNT